VTLIVDAGLVAAPAAKAVSLTMVAVGLSARRPLKEGCRTWEADSFDRALGVKVAVLASGA
jgi:hypothetical protein